MARVKLTAEVVASIQPGPKDQYLYDESTKGFCIRITPKGTRIAFVQRRLGKVTHKRVIGTLGESLSVKIARKKAELLWPKLGTEEDTGEVPTVASDTFDDLVKRWLDEHVRVKLKPRTRIDYEQIATTLKARFGKKKPGHITKDDCRKLHADMAKTPRRANYVLTVLGSILSYGGVSQTPTKGIARYRENIKERILAPAEMTAAYNAIATAEREKLLSVWACQALRFSILTGARPSEIRAIEWGFLDEQRKRVVLPDSKANRTRIIYTSTAAWTVLTSTPKFGKFVFAGADTDTPYQNLTRAWAKVRELAASGGVSLEGVRLYDVRHTFASEAAMAGHNLPMIGTLLGHTVPSTTARYVHLINAPAAAAAQDVGDRMAAALQAAASQSGATPINRKRPSK